MRQGVRIVLLAGALACFAALTVVGQGGATVIGVIYPECCAAYETALKSLKAELAKGGYGAGDAEIYEQKPSADIMSWTNAYRKFVGADVDLILIFGDELLEVACREKTRIPVVFGFVSRPATAKCVKSVEKPGGNVTGVSAVIPLFTLIDKAKKVKDFSTLGAFGLEGDKHAEESLEELTVIGNELGFRLVTLKAADRKDLVSALENASPFDVLFYPNFSVGVEDLKKISRTAAAKGLPVIAVRESEPESPSLMSLYADPAEQGRLMGQAGVRLLKGDPPSRTAVQPAKKIELEINLGMAREYGLKVPMDILKTATKVVK